MKRIYNGHKKIKKEGIEYNKKRGKILFFSSVRKISDRPLNLKYRDVIKDSKVFFNFPSKVSVQDKFERPGKMTGKPSSGRRWEIAAETEMLTFIVSLEIESSDNSAKLSFFCFYRIDLNIPLTKFASRFSFLSAFPFMHSIYLCLRFFHPHLT